MYSQSLPWFHKIFIFSGLFISANFEIDYKTELCVIFILFLIVGGVSSIPSCYHAVYDRKKTTNFILKNLIAIFLILVLQTFPFKIYFKMPHMCMLMYHIAKCNTNYLSRHIRTLCYNNFTTQSYELLALIVLTINLISMHSSFSSLEAIDFLILCFCAEAVGFFIDTVFVFVEAFANMYEMKMSEI